jgi:choline dehydrogenase-like flavoprotein
MTCIEEHFSKVVPEKYADRQVTIGRVANLTVEHNGRGPCQFRNLCTRGCPYAAYFSSNAVTLPAAAATGNLTLLPDSIAAEVLYDEKSGRAAGVRVINQYSKADTEYFARLIFINASTIATAALLLSSTSRRFPNGLGNSSGQVGHNLMDHFMGPGAYGEHDGFADRYYVGRRPNGIYIPRFRNLSTATRQSNYVRGFGYQGWGLRRTWDGSANAHAGFGKQYKERLLVPGPWSLALAAWGETLPYHANSVKMDPSRKDSWGLPLVTIDFEFGANERAMAADANQCAAEMLEAAGFRNVSVSSGDLATGGSAVHEMGTARMGRDPRTSVLNAFNQMHDVKNVFVTDGSCMTSSGSQNPSLTYMALTARACDYAVRELKSGNL